MDEIECGEISWIWKSYLVRGEVMLLEGDSGSGKLWVAQMISVLLCNGDKLPVVYDGEYYKIVKGCVLYFDQYRDWETDRKSVV